MRAGKLDRRIVLLEPGPETTNTRTGQRVKGKPIEHPVWAHRRDRGGSEGLQADTQVGEWKRRYEVRKPGLKSLNHTWTVIGEDGRLFDIEAVSEVPFGRNQAWWIYCVAKS